MPLTPWPKQSRKSLPTNVQRMFSGVDRQDAFSIRDTFSSDTQNMSSTNYPALSTRPGFSLVGTAQASRILGLATWKQTELHAVSNGDWYRFTGGSWASVGSGLSTSANMSFTNFKGGFSDINLIGANGVDVKRWDGTTLSTLSGAPSGINYLDTYADRLWGVTAGNTLNFSEYRVATNWTTITQSDTDPGFIVVETNDGEQICAVRSGVKRLVIFKPNSMFMLLGDYTSAFTLKQVANDIGTLSNQSVATISGQMYFVHQSGIYLYNGGTQPDKEFSLPIQNYIDRINPAAASKVCCGTDGINLYIGIPLDSATEPDTTLVYDTHHGTWYVWKGYAPLNYTQKLTTAFVGGVEGEVRQIGGSTSDNGTAITGKWVTKAFTGPSMAQRIRWKRAWVTCTMAPGSSLKVYMSQQASGDADWQLVQNIAATNPRVIIPTTAAYNAFYIRLKFEVTGVVTINEWSREEENLPIY